MPVGRVDFDQVDETDIQQLIDTGIPEGITFDYKSGRYAPGADGAREVLKDVSAFANTSGGHIIIGVVEDDLIPVSIVPLTEGVDAEIQRIENVVRDGITPRITGIRIRPIQVQGGSVIVIRIPRSWNLPHRITAQNMNRFYIRNSAGNYEMSVDELRGAFNLAPAIQERTRRFRSARLDLIRKSQTPTILSEPDGKLILHIVPFSALSGAPPIDLEAAYGKGLALQPMNSMGYTPYYNFDGLVNVMGGENCHGYTQVFRDGCIEAVRVRGVIERPAGRFIPADGVTTAVMETLPTYIATLQELGVAPPFTVMMTLTETDGACIGVDDRLLDLRPIQHDRLELPAIQIDDFGSPREYQRAMRPAFDALWNAGGFARSSNFNEKGDWVRSRPFG